VLESTGRLSKSLIGMSKVLGEIPLTVKLRTGIREGHNVSHKLMPRILDWGVSAMTVSVYNEVHEYSPMFNRVFSSMAAHVSRDTKSWPIGHISSNV
jgi:tRNA-dihydrouridine synthase 3